MKLVDTALAIAGAVLLLAVALALYGIAAGLWAAWDGLAWVARAAGVALSGDGA